jgi:hypothetical protein
MAEHALTSADRSDALNAGETMDHALESMRNGASGIVPAMGQMVYTASYALTYGIVFPLMLIVRVVPKNNALVRGMVDGARAAQERALGWDYGEEHVSEAHDAVHDDTPTGNGRRRRGGRHSQRRGRHSSQ